MTIPPGATFLERLHAMRQALDAACGAPEAAPLSAAEREALKQQILLLFREAEAAAQQAEGWKEAVRALANQWKQLDGGAPGRRPESSPRSAPATSPPVMFHTLSAASSGRIDHLGAASFLEKGWSRLSLLDVAAAEADFRRALELAPNHREAETMLAWALMLQERLDDALALLHRVLQHEPHRALALATLGYICLRTRRYDEAIGHLSAVIRADTDRRAVLYAHLYLGMTYREREMYLEAETCFRQALALGPNLVQAWYELGRAYWFAGRRDEARSAWQSGSGANKFSPWGTRCAELLQTVERGGAPPHEG
jgi:tetratricopeptide (TPR) repeat protein